MNFARFTKQINSNHKRGLAYALGFFSGVSALASFELKRQAGVEQERLDRGLKGLEGYSPIALNSQQLVQFPWAEGKLESWEYKLVTLRGYFEEEKVFIRKEKDGKAGFMVFAPFITAIDVSGEFNLNQPDSYHRSGIMVNLGWVPAEHSGDITTGNEPLPTIVTQQCHNLRTLKGFRETMLIPSQE